MIILLEVLTHWGRVTHICVSKLTIIGSDNDLSPGRRQAIIWIIAGILLIGPLWLNFNEILIKINTFSFKKMHLKMSSPKWHLFRLGLNVLSFCLSVNHCHSPYPPHLFSACSTSRPATMSESTHLLPSQARPPSQSLLPSSKTPADVSHRSSANLPGVEAGHQACGDRDPHLPWPDPSPAEWRSWPSADDGRLPACGASGQTDLTARSRPDP